MRTSSSRQYRVLLYAAICIVFTGLLWSCSDSTDPADPDPCNPKSPNIVDCGASQCEQLMITGDPYATTPGSFNGYSDPHLIVDPDNPDRIWLSYSWLEVGSLTNPLGLEVFVAIVTNHLAKSDDGGATFDFVSELWGSIPTPDPEGSGENGLIDSEVASLAWIRHTGSQVKWYGAHLRYFLRPVHGYNPKFNTSYTIRVTTADSPENLSGSPEAVLGVSSTAEVYDVDVALDVLVGKPLEDCAMCNNPSLFADGSTLYLVFECLAFSGTDLQTDRTTIQLIATEPKGAPETWVWRHVGEVVNGDAYTDLGVDVLQQPDIARSKNGDILLTVTPSAINPGHVERLHQGMIVLELEQLEPPVLARECNGALLVHARMTTEGLGGCTYSPSSATGVLCHSVQTDTEPRYLYVTGFHP